jgi:ATP-dependent phosphofructokinase / diphosphate-dependent phosphofructokinase
MKIGVLTSGGDCPGLNAVIRAITRTADAKGYEVLGILNGWKGLFDESYKPLNLNTVAGIVNRGGTILGTSRFGPFQEKNGAATLQNRVARAELDALIAIGGEGSMHIAQKAFELGINVIGVPKTIDNDINGTDFTFGFDTAVQIATDAIDRLHTTAESHHRIMILEVMGRHAGWIALHSGLAGGADLIIIPEYKITMEEIQQVLRNRYKRGKLFSIIVIAEGAEYLLDELNVTQEERKKDEFGRSRLGGISYYLANEIERRSGFDTRPTILGHVQRGGVPTAFDRYLGTRFGVYAVEMARDKKFGRMCAVRGKDIVDIPITEAIVTLKTVDKDTYNAAQIFFG